MFSVDTSGVASSRTCHGCVSLGPVVRAATMCSYLLWARGMAAGALVIGIPVWLGNVV